MARVLEFGRKAGPVGGFQQSWPQSPVHLDRRPDDPLRDEIDAGESAGVTRPAGATEEALAVMIGIHSVPSVSLC